MLIMLAVWHNCYTIYNTMHSFYTTENIQNVPHLIGQELISTKKVTIEQLQLSDNNDPYKGVICCALASKSGYYVF